MAFSATDHRSRLRSHAVYGFLHAGAPAVYDFDFGARCRVRFLVPSLPTVYDFDFGARCRVRFLVPSLPAVYDNRPFLYTVEKPTGENRTRRFRPLAKSYTAGPLADENRTRRLGPLAKSYTVGPLTDENRTWRLRRAGNRTRRGLSRMKIVHGGCGSQKMYTTRPLAGETCFYRTGNKARKTILPASSSSTSSRKPFFSAIARAIERPRP